LKISDHIPSLQGDKWKNNWRSGQEAVSVANRTLQWPNKLIHLPKECTALGCGSHKNCFNGQKWPKYCCSGQKLEKRVYGPWLWQPQKLFWWPKGSCSGQRGTHHSQRSSPSGSREGVPVDKETQRWLIKNICSGKKNQSVKIIL